MGNFKIAVDKSGAVVTLDERIPETDVEDM